MGIAVPTLSTKGMVIDPADKADTLISHFYVADTGNTQLYRGKITSLPALVQEFRDDAVKLQNGIRSALMTYLGNYYQSVDVQAKVDINTDGSFTIRMFITVVEDGNAYSLGHQLVANGASIKDIIRLNEQGV